MANWIENVSPPKELFLAWQAPDHLKDRFRWAVGRLILSGSTVDLCYFAGGKEFEHFNQGRTFSDLQKLGYEGYPGFRLDIVQKDVLPSLMRRLPPRNRSDFKDFKKQFRIPPDLPLSDISLLAITEAKLPSDGFSVVDPFDIGNSSQDLLLEIAGFRYYVGADKPLDARVGQAVDILPEPDNQYDPGAVQVSFEGRKIGNINRLQAPVIAHWLRTHSVSACIERLNGSSSKPRAFVFVRVRPSINLISTPRVSY